MPYLQLKSGEFSTLYHGMHRVSGKMVAINYICGHALPQKDDAAVYNAVSILFSILHPHIAPLIGFFKEANAHFLVREFLSGGEVLKHIGNIGSSYSKGDTCDIIQHLFSALACCHEH
jgi:serine/threonine protein kinase